MLIRTTSIVLLFATACGNDDNAMGASGVARGKVIGDLSQAEQNKLCNWVDLQQFELPIRSECESDAVFNSRTRAECDAYRDACVAAAPADRAEERGYGRQNCDDEENPRPDCKLTIAALETCINDMTAAESAFYGAITCDMAGQGVDDHVPDPPSCAKFDLSCDF